MPGVTYEKSVQFTPRGPVVAHVLRGPRPVGLYALKPILSNDVIIGREKVTQMQRRLSTTATVAGVNGDLFNLSVGYPSGMLLMNGVLASPPNPDRSSTGIAPDGTLARRPRQVRGNVAGRGAAPAARAEQGSRRGRDRAVHVGVRPGDTGGDRDGRGRPDAVSGGRAASRPRRHRRAGEAGRRDADPAGRRRARRSRSDRRRPARDRGAARVERDRPPDADAGLVGARRRRRRRAGARCATGRPIFRSNEGFTTDQLVPRRRGPRSARRRTGASCSSRSTDGAPATASG